MIKNLYGNSSWITVNQQGTTMPYLNNQPMAGMVRVNSSMNRTEVYDGHTWIPFGSDAHVDLSETAKQTLAWAQEKMLEEQRLKELMSHHPGLRDLNDKFEMMKILCEQEEQQ